MQKNDITGVDSKGLGWDEARARLALHGPNIATPRSTAAWYSLLWHAFKNPFNYVLLFLGIISWLTDDLKAATVMLSMTVMATGVRFWQEYRSRVHTDSLRNLVRNTVTVLRHPSLFSGPANLRPPPTPAEIPMEELVPGDLVQLSAGDMIPADVVFLDSSALFINQSPLTGESMPVEKRPHPARAASPAVSPADDLDSPHHAFMGSSVVSGKATALVLATGPRTRLGAIAATLHVRQPETAFDQGVNKVSGTLIRAMLAMVPVVFLLNGMDQGDWLESFFFAVAIAVSLTPEMLPMIVNTNLARGAVVMARHRVIVKRLGAMQSFGAMDVLCTDKTGTLTQGRTVLLRHFDPEGRPDRRVLEHAYLNSRFQSGLKNLIDTAIIDRAALLGLREAAAACTLVGELPFDFARRRMSVVIRRPGGGPTQLVCKGAVEEMLSICDNIDIGGRIQPMTDAVRARIKTLRDEFNDDGMRVVAVAYKAIASRSGPFTAADETGLILSGYIAFLDPPKDTSAPALRLLQNHGVAVKILTGDNVPVARRICRDVGLDVAYILTGSDIDALYDDALPAAAARTTLFAKLEPVQKARVVSALKRAGHTVGFLGDGINDAPALREADVGISVEGADAIAREAADIILLEKSLIVLERGVVEGRRVFGNIVKYLKMTTSANFGNAISVLLASLVLPFLPMMAIHLLIQNLLYDFAQLSMPWDTVDESWLRRPRKWSASGITRFMLRVGPVSSLLDIIMFLGLWFIFGANTPDKEHLFQSGWFVAGLFTQTLIMHFVRTEKIPFVQTKAAPPVLLLTGFVLAVGCLLPFTALGRSVELEALPPGYWLFLAATVGGYCLLMQYVKRRYIKKYGEWL
ncbi:magnesium-translocating P-type ATPase [Opitutaceae bacterium TAV4]|nr:magnesium-translocating P-type ATPase [Opitutaceae bacterium TAV4]RRJ98354.1 magnesium-translocating P-type ATPase [Opitutaceae bacterium TAV3]